MSKFEFKVIPAPIKGTRVRGVKSTQARFALSLETVMNEMGADGWDYVRTDTLPVEERQGLTGKTTTYQNMLVFRRPVEDEVALAPEADVVLKIQSATSETLIDVPAVAASNVTPLRPVQPEPAFGEMPTASDEALEAEEPGNYDGPRLNPVLLARARRRQQSSMAAE
ncbi:MAG: DUF4177 domain-containing protein [Shimia sp.]